MTYFTQVPDDIKRLFTMEISDHIREMMDEWKRNLEEAELNQVQILEAYFKFRSNLPGQNIAGEPLVKDPLTTMDIVDDLKDMMPLDTALVNTYMRKNEFGLMTDIDGKVKWAIWRDMTPIQM